VSSELPDSRDPMWAVLVEASITPVAPPPGLRQRLLDEIRTAPKAELRRGAERWRPTEFAGISLCPLHNDKASGRRTFYLRMEPGAVIPSHVHGADEQCLVLEGDISWGGRTYYGGDYFVTGQGSAHPVSSTAGGNLLLIIAGDNEYAVV
jgi:anti-sigma factor ChrR (cupin superfamily)